MEIRYSARAPKSYRAAAANLTPIAGAPILPEDHCVPAEPAPESPAAGAKAAPKPAARARAGASAVRSVSDDEVEAWADGACSGNPGPAGLGVVVRFGGKRLERSEYLGEGTNNIAELTAIDRVLEMVEDHTLPIVLFTDSQYSIGVLAGGWKAKANQALIAALRARLVGRKVRFVHVRGHAGVALNERCDELARRAISTRSTKQTESEDTAPKTKSV